VQDSVRRSDGTPVTVSAGVVNAPPDVEIDRVLAAEPGGSVEAVAAVQRQ
jgi:hypothetical protein